MVVNPHRFCMFAIIENQSKNVIRVDIEKRYPKAENLVKKYAFVL